MAGRTAAAACSCWTCWRSQECSAPSLSRVICCRPCLTFTGKKRIGIERSGPTPSAFRRASWPGGSGTGGAPTAAAGRHCCWTAAEHMHVLVCIFIWSRSVRRLDDSLRLPTVLDLHRKNKNRHRKKWPYTLKFHRASWPGGSGTGGAPTAAVEHHRCWTAAVLLDTCTCWFVTVYRDI